MSWELFLASLFCTAGASLAVYLLLARRLRPPGERLHGDDLTSIESRLSDLITELNHVANSHVNAVEDRRDELKRVIELANEKIRRLNSLMADLEILEGRRRAGDGRAAEREAAPLARAVPAVRGAPRRRDLHAEIRRLAAEGEAIEDIALRTKVPEHEVELIIRRAAADPPEDEPPARRE